MPMFRKKPVTIEAMQYTGDLIHTCDILHWAHAGLLPEANAVILDHRTHLAIRTLEGLMTAVKDDWIIKGVKGEFYPCKPDIFAATYEPVDGQAQQAGLQKIFDYGKFYGRLEAESGQDSEYTACPMQYVENAPPRDDDWAVAAKGGMIVSEGLQREDAELIAVALNTYKPAQQDAEKVNAQPAIRKDVKAVLLSLDVPIYGYMASHSQTLHKTSQEIGGFESAIPLVSQSAHRRACDQIAALIPAQCKGRNCEATDSVSHSSECRAEHDDAIGYVEAQPDPAMAADVWLSEFDNLLDFYRYAQRSGTIYERVDASNNINRHARKRVQPANGEDALTAAARDVFAERRRQVEAEGWTSEHDDEHANGEMAGAAACYAVSDVIHWTRHYVIKTLWPWAPGWWKPSDRRRNLVKAGALILAEIERLDRAAMQQGGQP